MVEKLQEVQFYKHVKEGAARQVTGGLSGSRSRSCRAVRLELCLKVGEEPLENRLQGEKMTRFVFQEGHADRPTAGRDTFGR